MFVADPKKAVGGHVMAHTSTIRLSLRKGKAEQRLMKVVDAPNLRACPPCAVVLWCCLSSEVAKLGFVLLLCELLMPTIYTSVSAAIMTHLRCAQRRLRPRSR